MSNLLKKEMEKIDLGDKRLDKRLAIIVESFLESPSSSIPQSCASKSKAKATYRFFENDNVSADQIRKGFFKATAERANKEKEVLVLSDSTNIVYSSHKNLKGKGVLRNYRASGFALHTAYVVTPQGEPLGVLAQKFWGRKEEEYGKRKERANLPIEQKESHRWLECNTKTQELISTKNIIVADRGADIFEVFAQERRKNCDLLIRACHNRKIDGRKEKLFKVVESAPILGNAQIEVGRAPNRASRSTTLNIHATTVYISKNSSEKIKVNVVLAKESSVPKDESRQIVWRLLTTLPIETFEQAYDCVKKYALRWLIERYHYVLKSGCKIEELQLEAADRIERAVATYCIVAYKLMQITYFARLKPNLPANKLFKKDELTALYCFVKNKKTSLPENLTVVEVIRMLATLGGFMGRKGDGPPGVKVVWIGLRRLSDIKRSYLLWSK